MTHASGFRFTLTIAAGFALAAPALSAAGFAPQAAFRSGVDLVALTVTVTDRAANYIAGLTKDDFVVTEDGVPQPLTFFASDHVPLDLAIVLDTSGSMGAALRIVQEAACGLARSLRAGDRGVVVEVKAGAQIPQPLTGDVPGIEAAIRRTTQGGRTGLYDGLYVVLQEFTRQRQENPEMRRQALVVLSDGADNASHIEFDRVLDLARRAGVGVYIISPKPVQMRSVFASDFEDTSRLQYSMNALAREAGGLIFFPVNTPDLHRVYETIATELANQYELGYVPISAAADGRFRHVSVRVVSRTDVQARTRAGYFAGGSAPLTVPLRGR